MSDETPAARTGSGADLSRRIDRLETAHEILAREVGGLTTTIARVELNQAHGEELQKLRYDSTVSALHTVEGRVTTNSDRIEAYIERMDKLVSGETQTARTTELMDEHKTWRASVESRFDAAETLAVQVKLLGRLGMLLVGGSVVTATVAVYTALNGA